MKLKDKYLSVGIWSENHEKLAKWYEKVLGFDYKCRIDYPNDKCIEFKFGKNYFFVGWHNKIHGKNKDKYRIMIGFNVKSVTKTAEELEKRGVKFIAKPFEGPPGGFWCTTIEDPEGNLLQFYGDK
jgi:predicted enzyme related to lactoylglutathione lyase